MNAASPADNPEASTGDGAGSSPRRAGLVLTALILAAGVANLYLAVANVALPTIGSEFNASQVQLNLIAVGYSLGLAASVLYFGAIGDRYGRKLLLMSGLSLFLFSLFLQSPIEKEKMLSFVGLVLLGGWSLSLVFSFLAAIAARAQQNAAIMAVLGFPIIIPQLLLLMRLSNAAFAPLLSIPATTVLLLVALDLMVILLAVILFPFLWKD